MDNLITCCPLLPPGRQGGGPRSLHTAPWMAELQVEQGCQEQRGLSGSRGASQAAGGSGASRRRPPQAPAPAPWVICGEGGAGLSGGRAREPGAEHSLWGAAWRGAWREQEDGPRELWGLRAGGGPDSRGGPRLRLDHPRSWHLAPASPAPGDPCPHFSSPSPALHGECPLLCRPPGFREQGAWPLPLLSAPPAPPGRAGEPPLARAVRARGQPGGFPAPAQGTESAGSRNGFLRK